MPHDIGNQLRNQLWSLYIPSHTVFLFWTIDIERSALLLEMSPWALPFEIKTSHCGPENEGRNPIRTLLALSAIGTKDKANSIHPLSHELQLHSCCDPNVRPI